LRDLRNFFCSTDHFAIGVEFNMPILLFRDKTFHETSDADGDEISLTFEASQKKVILKVPPDCSLIDRLTAQRQADGITRSGWLSKDGTRYGEGYELQIEGLGGKMPDRLCRSPREVY